ncbi:MAG: hypothetical protein R3F17_11705 [Planctomycetota bacterium]
MAAPYPLDPALAGLPVAGFGLNGPRFADNLDGQGTLLVFLRHLG